MRIQARWREIVGHMMAEAIATIRAGAGDGDHPHESGRRVQRLAKRRRAGNSIAARTAMSVSVRADLSRQPDRAVGAGAGRIGRSRSRSIGRSRPSRTWKPLMRDLRRCRACRSACRYPASSGEPLTFRPWTKGSPMVRGRWEDPIPPIPAEVGPKTLIAPIVGLRSCRLSPRLWRRVLRPHAGEVRRGEAHAAAIGVGWSLFRPADDSPAAP